MVMNGMEENVAEEGEGFMNCSVIFEISKFSLSEVDLSEYGEDGDDLSSELIVYDSVVETLVLLKVGNETLEASSSEEVMES